MVLPLDITLGGVWTLRSGRPFTASAGVDLDGNRNNDYVPGTKKGDGNRMDMDEFLGLVNTFRATRNLAPIPESQIDSDNYQRFDLRVVHLDRAIGECFDRAQRHCGALLPARDRGVEIRVVHWNTSLW